MIKNLIFDLSEVIINGILGVEKALPESLGITQPQVADTFWGKEFERLLLGEIDEDSYVSYVINSTKWNIRPEELKKAIRLNFHTEIDGVIPLLQDLAKSYKLYLLSDHSKEWVEYIKTVHPFLEIFEKTAYSYELKMVKKNPAVFPELLRQLGLKAEECLFIDDHQRNVDNARLAGIDGIRFLNANQLREELGKKNIIF
ncbi:MAG: HAD-IA family hydrolase [Ignavibacteria bacterium]|jgi:putative hydrolase of the HAD superfamily|nr:HAD-IA family hydrolase [Ignavibacteria bacterium]MCU7522421.1 HAD-IA family hydrolase [Ignavibacteria bacterium]